MDTNVNTGEKKIIKIEAMRREIIRILWIILLIAMVFLFLRILLKLFGADPDTLFVGFIYAVSGFFLLPFFGMFPQLNDPLPGQPSIDAVALLAFFCYIILISLCMGVIYIGSNVIKTNRKVTETMKYNNPVDETREVITKVSK